MAYVFLGVLPKEIVDFIYHNNNSEYAFIYFTKFKFTFKKNGQGQINSLSEVYNWKELYQKHIKIKNIYNYLTSILECNHLYSREKLQPLLYDISKLLMFFHNINIYILDKEKSLKEDNTNYILTKSSIKLWFKLCQKYNVYLLLCFIKDGKKYAKIFNPNKMNEIDTFLHFIISPIVLLNEVCPDKNILRTSLMNNDYVSKKPIIYI